MHKRLIVGASGFVLLTAAAFAQSGQSDEEKAKAFFKNNLEQSAEDYVSSRIEQSLSERFRNVEIQIDDFDGEDTGFSVFTVQPFLDDRENGRYRFFQGSLISRDGVGTLNLGLAQRWAHKDNKILTGLNIFYDNEWEAGHERLGIGGEILTSVGDVRINNYSALSGTLEVDGANEVALDGMDFELALPLPYLPTSKFHWKSFEWTGDEAQEISGSTVSLRVLAPYGLTLEVGSTSYDAEAKDDAEFVSINFNLANLSRYGSEHQRKFISDRAFEFKEVTERRFEKVRRQNSMVVNGAGIQSGVIPVQGFFRGI